MSYTFYSPTPSYRVATYPPRLYAHEPTLESYHDTDNDTEYFTPQHGMLGGPTSGYQMGPPAAGPLASTEGTILALDEFVNGQPRPTYRETEEYLRRNLGIPAPTPVNLWSIPNDRTPTIGEMIKLAIWGSPQKRLRLSQIYAAIMERYPEKRVTPKSDTKAKAWQRSVRHNLSYVNMFVNIERPSDHPGLGKYWLLDIRHGEGRRQPRGRRERDDQEGSQDPSTDEEASPSPAPSNTSSPQQGWVDPHIKTESPRLQLDMLPFAPPDTAMMDRLGYMNLEGRSTHMYHSGGDRYHGYHHQPPHAINPRMIAGDYPHNDMIMGPSVPRLSRRGDITMQMIPEALPMHMINLQPHAGPSSSSSGPTRRRPYEESGLEDDEGRARGIPKARRHTE